MIAIYRGRPEIGPMEEIFRQVTAGRDGQVY